MEASPLTPTEAARVQAVLEDVGLWTQVVLKHPETLEPFVPNFVQRAMFAAGRRAKKVAVRTHRRGGKTYGLSAVALHGATTHRNFRVLVVAPDQGKVDEIFNNIRAFVGACPALEASVVSHSKNPQRIAFANLSVIQGKTTGATAAKAGRGVRGFTADLVIVDETAFLHPKDYLALNAIIRGDATRHGKVQVYAASTPDIAEGEYYEWCTDPARGWEPVHIPITGNPDWSAGDVEQIRLDCSRFEWEQEYLAEFPNLGDYAFRETDIQAAGSGRWDYLAIPPTAPARRVIGVDWDRVQAGVNIAVVELSPAASLYKVIYREEIPKQEFTLVAGERRVIELNEVFQPDYIYVDAGGGEAQCEHLKLHGLRHPDSRLKDRLVRMQFSEMVATRDPVTGQAYKKMFKVAMVNHLFKLFESQTIRFSEKDRDFPKQLRKYKITGISAKGIQTSSTDEHMIDAVGLACFGLFTHFNDPVASAFRPATESYRKPAPRAVESRAARQRRLEQFARMGSAVLARDANRQFARGNLGGAGWKRSRF